MLFDPFKYHMAGPTKHNTLLGFLQNSLHSFLLIANHPANRKQFLCWIKMVKSDSVLTYCFIHHFTHTTLKCPYLLCKLTSSFNSFKWSCTTRPCNVTLLTNRLQSILLRFFLEELVCALFFFTSCACFVSHNIFL